MQEKCLCARAWAEGEDSHLWQKAELLGAQQQPQLSPCTAAAAALIGAGTAAAPLGLLSIWVP